MSVPYLEKSIAISPDDIDRLNHVNNIVYLKWVQELAISHWQRDAAPEEQSSVLWVVIRHEIDYKRSAKLGDEIIGKTWVGEASDKSFQRHTEIRRKKDDKVLAKALTFWCPIDAITLKPTSVNSQLRKRFSV